MPVTCSFPEIRQQEMPGILGGSPFIESLSVRLLATFSGSVQVSRIFVRWKSQVIKSMMLHDQVVYSFPLLLRSSQPRNLHQLGNMFLVKYVRVIKFRGTKNT